MNAISELEREASRILERLRRLEQLSVPSVGKLLGKDVEWVRKNLPVIVLSAKSHRVRSVDIEAFLQKRTLYPKNGNTL